MDLPIYRPQHLNILRRIRERRITLVVLTILCSIAFTVCRFAHHEIADEYRRRGDRCVAEMNTIQQQLQSEYLIYVAAPDRWKLTLMDDGLIGTY